MLSYHHGHTTRLVGEGGGTLEPLRPRRPRPVTPIPNAGTGRSITGPHQSQTPCRAARPMTVRRCPQQPFSADYVDTCSYMVGFDTGAAVANVDC